MMLLMIEAPTVLTACQTHNVEPFTNGLEKGK